MSLRTTGLACVLVLATACAAHPEKPDRAAPAAPAVSESQLFHGCKLHAVWKGGYTVDCGNLTALVRRDSIAPSAEREKFVADLRKHAAAPIRTAETRVAVGTRSLRGVRLSMSAGPRNPSPVFVIEMTAVAAPGGGSVGLGCGWVPGADRGRCPALLAWLYAHQTTPPKLPNEDEETPDASAWPPAKELVVPDGCERDQLSPTEVHLACNGVDIELDLKMRRPLGLSMYEQMASLAGAAATLFGPHKTKEASPFDCTVGGKPAACFRRALPMPADAHGTMFIGVGELYGDTVLVTCSSRTSTRTVPPVCAGFLRAGAATGP